MKIKSINIKDFLSIKNLSYTFEDGLHLFTGNNGAGKSSILLALQVGLFNKCERPQPWARLSGPGGFIIEVEFTSVQGTHVRVVNNRTRNRYEVYEEGELLTYQISKGIPMVAKMLNLNYHEFTLLTFLTPSTVSNILTGTDSSLISKFFSLDVLSEYDKALREERRELTKDKKKLEAKLMEEMNTYKGRSVGELEKLLGGYRTSKSNLINSEVHDEMHGIRKDLLSCSRDLQEAELKNKHAVESLEALSTRGSSCPTCGHSLEADTTTMVITIGNLRDTIGETNNTIRDESLRYKELSNKLRSLQEPFDDKVEKLNTLINRTEAELIAASIITERESIDTDNINKELVDLERKIFALNTALDSIKSGSVHRAYLETFTSVLNNKLGTFKEELKLNMRVIAKISSTGLSFNILDDGVYKSAEVLSAGEKVIVGLLVLSAMFDTLGDTLDIYISTIMLDEAIGAVSKENMPIVEQVVGTMARTRCVIVTQHHEELAGDIFSTITEIMKKDGLTELKEI